MTDDARAQLFRQILAWNDDRTLLERMKLHGFWPQDQGLPPDPQDEAAERKQIEAEMRRLRKQQLAGGRSGAGVGGRAETAVAGKQAAAG